MLSMLATQAPPRSLEHLPKVEGQILLEYAADHQSYIQQRPSLKKDLYPLKERTLTLLVSSHSILKSPIRNRVPHY